MLDYYLPIQKLFQNPFDLSSESVKNAQFQALYEETKSSQKTMIPSLILEMVINQFCSTKHLFENIEHLSEKNSGWIILSFNPKTMTIEINTETTFTGDQSTICLVVKSAKDFSNIEWDIVRSRYNQIIKLQ